MATCRSTRISCGPSVDSVLAQERRRLELIIADDGSGASPRAGSAAHLAKRSAGARVVAAASWAFRRGAQRRLARGARPLRGVPGFGRCVAAGKLSSQLAAFAATAGARWCYTACHHIDARGAHIAPGHISAWSSHDGESSAMRWPACARMRRCPPCWWSGSSSRKQACSMKG